MSGEVVRIILGRPGGKSPAITLTRRGDLYQVQVREDDEHPVDLADVLLSERGAMIHDGALEFAAASFSLARFVVNFQQAAQDRPVILVTVEGKPPIEFQGFQNGGWVMRTEAAQCAAVMSVLRGSGVCREVIIVGNGVWFALRDPGLDQALPLLVRLAALFPVAQPVR